HEVAARVELLPLLPEHQAGLLEDLLGVGAVRQQQRHVGVNPVLGTDEALDKLIVLWKPVHPCTRPGEGHRDHETAARRARAHLVSSAVGGIGRRSAEKTRALAATARRSPSPAVPPGMDSESDPPEGAWSTPVLLYKCPGRGGTRGPQLCGQGPPVGR